MSKLFFTSDKIIIYRQRRITSTNRFTLSATFTVYDADIQPASRERIELVNGRFGSVYTAFFDANVPIKEGDQIIIVDTGKKYAVKGVQKYSGAGLLDYIEALLMTQDSK